MTIENNFRDKSFNFLVYVENNFDIRIVFGNIYD